jgi:DNA helicase IV
VHWIVAGDLMQQGSESNWNGWDQIAQALGVRAKNTRSVWLSKSYRVPPKIHVAAEALRQAVYPQSLPSQSVSWHPHSGRVAVAIVPSLQDQAGRVLEWIEELHHAQMVSIALLAPDAATQAVWADRTHDWAWPIQHLNAFAAYSGGLALTTLDFVRGLEFDAVILLDCSATAYPHTPAGARMLYTALTRARRQAYLLATDAPSEWLEVLERAVTRPQS